MKLRPFATTLATAASLTLAAPAWAGYVFSFNVLPNPVVVGDTLTVDVIVDNDTNGMSVLGFDLLFDPTVLAFQSAVGTGSFSVDFFDANEVSSGQINTIVFYDILDIAKGDGSVGTFTFKAISAGASSLDIDYLTAYITDGIVADHGLGWIDDITSNPGSVTVDPRVTNGVPIPGTLLLAGLGLALLGGSRWRSTLSPAAR